jgi:hypothetical protein
VLALASALSSVEGRRSPPLGDVGGLHGRAPSEPARAPRVAGAVGESLLQGNDWARCLAVARYWLTASKNGSLLIGLVR